MGLWHPMDPEANPPVSDRSPSAAADGELTPRAWRTRADGELLDELLEKTSRTFALAIPLLPEPTRQEVSIAYLLFRIADTFEDATVRWGRTRQIEALRDLSSLLERPSETEAGRLVERWLSGPPTEHQGYRQLLAEVPAVLGAFLALSPASRRAIRHHTLRTAAGMSAFVARTRDDGVLRLDNVPDLQAYCYTVAGIVGEMLTELFVLGRDHLQPIAGYLRERAASFGEGLQLVNILKDSAGDVTEGRQYLPPEIDRSEIFALARRDLDTAAEYVLAIQRSGGPDGLVTFTGLPVQLARATLDRVERDGPGSKLTRSEVFRIHQRLHRALARNRPAVPLR